MKMLCSHNAPKMIFNGNFADIFHTFKFILLMQDFILVLQTSY